MKTKLIAGVLGAVLVAALVYACGRANPSDTASSDFGSSTTTTVTPTIPLTGQAGTPQDSEPESVATQALTIAFSWQPATDATRTDAYIRATKYFTDTLARAATIHVTTQRGPGLDWEQWRTDNAHITATVTLGCSGCPPDRPDTISRTAIVHQTAVYPDGRTAALDPDTLVWVTIVKARDGWRLDTITY